MILDYKKQNTLSYNRFIELYADNEKALRDAEQTEEQKQIANQIEEINKKINSADCTSCAKAKYQRQLGELGKKLNVASLEVQQYLQDKKLIMNYLEKNNLFEDIKLLNDIDNKLNIVETTKKAVVKKAVKKTPKKKVEDASKSK